MQYAPCRVCRVDARPGAGNLSATLLAFGETRVSRMNWIYTHIVCSMAAKSRTTAFLVYDQDFRTLQGHTYMLWCFIHQELLLSVNGTSPAAQSTVFPQRKHASVLLESFSAGYCSAFCNSGQWIPCHATIY